MARRITNRRWSPSTCREIPDSAWPRDPLERSKVESVDFLTAGIECLICKESRSESSHETTFVTPRRDDRRKFIVGEHLTLTYITYIPFYTRRERYTVEIGDNYPNLKRWGES